VSESASSGRKICHDIQWACLLGQSKACRVEFPDYVAVLHRDAGAG